MNTLTTFLKIIDWQTTAVAALALLLTFICRHYGFVFEMPTGLIGIAVIFPLVFSIVTAFRRREDALKYFASLKAHTVGLYFAHRDWPPAGKSQAAQAEKLVQDLLTAVANYFQADDQEQALYRVYAVIDAFSLAHEQLRQVGVPANEVSRANQYLRAIIIEFERMKNIARYRTPVALRAYSRLFLNLFPIIFAPYFASVGYPAFPIAGYVVALVYALVLVSLDNVQDHLENPYDGVGPDDLRLNVAGVYTHMITGNAAPGEVVLS